jgi:hypothetical protein
LGGYIVLWQHVRLSKRDSHLVMCVGEGDGANLLGDLGNQKLRWLPAWRLIRLLAADLSIGQDMHGGVLGVGYHRLGGKDRP